MRDHEYKPAHTCVTTVSCSQDQQASVMGMGRISDPKPPDSPGRLSIMSDGQQLGGWVRARNPQPCKHKPTRQEWRHARVEAPIFTHIYIYIYMCVCVCVRLHTYIHIYIYIYVNKCPYVYAPIYMSVLRQLVQEDRDEEFYFAPLKAKKGKVKNKGRSQRRWSRTFGFLLGNRGIRGLYGHYVGII